METPAVNTGPTALTEAAQAIAAQLGETEAGTIESIRRIIEVLGMDETHALLAEALKVEAEGGLMVRNGSRRRTLGGVFFYLVKPRLPWGRRSYIWSHQKKARPKKKQQPKKSSGPPFEWDDRLAIVPELIKEKGEVRTVKVTLIGRPGKVIEKETLVLTSMQGGKPPALPAGLPPAPAEPTTYIVFIAKKQWRKVAEALKDPQDVLIIEGYQAFDKRLQTVTVFAQSTTTKALQQARREAQKQKS